MKLRNLFLPSIALGAAVLLATPEESKAFSLLGYQLNPNRSDFRVFNNFADVHANNNTTPDPNFPGYTGAILAVWKACTEWSSGPHGDGTGDPHQAVLGSGGSSFDPFFNGEATGIGVIGDNVVSVLPQTGPATLGFLQGDSTGWWIRLYETHTWSDGPGTNIGLSNYDIQGVVCSLYGHALGLGTSTISSATMYPMTANGSVQERSLASDDVLGIQALYGLANSSGTKPTIGSVVYLGSQIQIVGNNFQAIDNEIWFTRLTPGPTSGPGGGPIKVSGLSSTNGNTEILLSIPPTAGPGEVLVKLSGTGQGTTSAAFPFHPLGTGPPTPKITSIVPSQVPPLTDTGGSNVVILGVGFTDADFLFVNNFTVGLANLPFSGDWTIDSDTQISFTMPLTQTIGLVDVDLSVDGVSLSTQIEIVPPSAPSLTVATSQLIQANGLGLAVTSQALDVVVLEFSIVDGPTTIPGILELEIGGGNLNNLFKIKTWTIGTKLWRKLISGPVSGLPPGLEIFFECIVLPASQGYDTPWQSTNKVMVTVLG